MPHGRRAPASRWRPLGALLPLLAVALLAGCGGDAPAGGAASLIVRDSAGVEILDVPASVLDALPVWTLADEPLLSIGEGEEGGEAPYRFSTLDALGVLALDDGGLALVDGTGSRGSGEIRIFDAQGRFVRAMGGAGEDQGEPGSAPTLWRQSAGMAALDAGDGTLTVYGLDGAVLETRQVGATDCPYGPCLVPGVLGDGTVVLHSRERDGLSVTGQVGGIPGELRASYGLWTDDGYREMASLPLPEDDAGARRVTGGLVPSGAPMASPSLTTPPPAPELTAEGAISVGYAHLALTSTRLLEIRIFRADGQLTRIIRIDAPSGAMAEEDRWSALDSAGHQDPPAGDTAVSTTRPGVGYVRFGDGDDLWVRDFWPGAPAASAAERITIFGVDGAPVARLQVPPDPLHEDQRRAARHQAPSSRDHYRVITADAAGVHRLLVFEILKEGGAP